MNSDTVLKHGDIVQLNPDFQKNGCFSGCLMIITEPKAFGAQGVVFVPGARGEMPGQAFYRAKWEEMELVGRAEWAPKEYEEE